MLTRRIRFLTALLLCLALAATTGGCGANIPTDNTQGENSSPTVTQQPETTQPAQETQPAASQDATSTPDASNPEFKILTVKPGDNLQSVFDEAGEGYEIVISAGTYQQDTSLYINEKKNLTIRGEGEVLIASKDIYNTVLEMVDCSGISLTNIKACHTNLRGESCLGEVVKVNRCKDMVFEACEFNGCGSCGILAIDSEGIAITDCYIYQNSWVGIYLENTKGVTLKDSRIVNNAGDIQNDDNSEITMAGGNTIENNDLMTYLTYVIDQGTASARQYFQRGRIYLLDLNDPDSAIADFNKTIEYDPQYAEAYRDRGYAYLSKEMLVEALSDFNSAFELYPTDGWLLNDYGIYYKTIGDYKKAADSYTKSIAYLLEVNPHEDIQWILLDRAECYKELGMKDEMIADLKASADLGNSYALEQLKAAEKK